MASRSEGEEAKVQEEARLHHEEESSCLQCVGVLEPELAQEHTPTAQSST